MIIAVDFDGTIVTHEYPKIGQPVWGALTMLRLLNKKGHRIILYTIRSGEELKQAVDYLNTNNIELWGVNENPTQKEWTNSIKVYANLYIDDAAYGCPLVVGEHKRPFVDWSKVNIPEESTT